MLTCYNLAERCRITYAFEHKIKQKKLSNRNPIITNEPVEFEKQPVEVEECRKITDHARGFHRIYPKLIKEITEDVHT